MRSGLLDFRSWRKECRLANLPAAARQFQAQRKSSFAPRFARSFGRRVLRGLVLRSSKRSEERRRKFRKARFPENRLDRISHEVTFRNEIFKIRSENFEGRGRRIRCDTATSPEKFAAEF